MQLGHTAFVSSDTGTDVHEVMLLLFVLCTMVSAETACSLAAPLNNDLELPCAQLLNRFISPIAVF